jgi:hypothetical protein
MQLFGAIKFTYINGGPHILCLCLLDEGGNEIRARILNKIKKMQNFKNFMLKYTIKLYCKRQKIHIKAKRE